MFTICGHFLALFGAELDNVEVIVGFGVTSWHGHDLASKKEADNHNSFSFPGTIFLAFVFSTKLTQIVLSSHGPRSSFFTKSVPTLTRNGIPK